MGRISPAASKDSSGGTATGTTSRSCRAPMWDPAGRTGAGAWAIRNNSAPRGQSGTTCRGYVVGERRNGADDLAHDLVGYARRRQAGGEMPGHEIEVVHGDASTLMNLPHRRAGVRIRSAERSSEEFHLLALQPLHVGPSEEPSQLVVGQH